MGSLTKLAPDRRFGLLFALLFGGIGVYGLTNGGSRAASAILLTASLVVGLIALVAPRALTPFTRAWIYLGELMGRVVSPVVLAFIFFGILTPVALVCRLFGRDELRLKRRVAASYWIGRDPPGPAAQSFNNQF